MAAKKKKAKKTKSVAKKKSTIKVKETLSLDMPFALDGSQETSFKRADLVFTDINHSGISYEVRVFLNNTSADHKTARSKKNGYAGRFVVFGHGNCFGDVGHCDVPSVGGEINRHLQHPVTPQKKTLTVTDSLRKILDKSDDGLNTVTLVPVSKAPNQADRGLPALDELKKPKVSLRTYR